MEVLEVVKLILLAGLSFVLGVKIGMTIKGGGTNDTD